MHISRNPNVAPSVGMTVPQVPHGTLIFARTYKQRRVTPRRTQQIRRFVFDTHLGRVIHLRCNPLTYFLTEHDYTYWRC